MKNWKDFIDKNRENLKILIEMFCQKLIISNVFSVFLNHLKAKIINIFINIVHLVWKFNERFRTPWFYRSFAHSWLLSIFIYVLTKNNSREATSSSYVIIEYYRHCWRSEDPVILVEEEIQLHNIDDASTAAESRMIDCSSSIEI